MEFQVGRFLENLRDQHWESNLFDNMELMYALPLVFQLGMLRRILRGI